MGNMQITNAPARWQADTLFMVVEHLAERPPLALLAGYVLSVRLVITSSIMAKSGQHNGHFCL